jgi:hypothetical protein
VFLEPGGEPLSSSSSSEAGAGDGRGGKGKGKAGAGAGAGAGPSLLDSDNKLSRQTFEVHCLAGQPASFVIPSESGRPHNRSKQARKMQCGGHRVR